MTTIGMLARRGNLTTRRVMDAFSPDQPRDEGGRWSPEGSTSANSAAAHERASVGHRQVAIEARQKGDMEMASAHENAANLHSQAAQARRDATKAGNTREAYVHAMSLGITARAASGKMSPSVYAGHAGHEVHTERVKMETSSSSRTMTELPAIKEASSKQLAPWNHQVRASSTPGQEKPRMGSDPNRTTQKLPVVTENPSVAAGHSRGSRQEAAAAAAGKWASKALEAKRKK